MLEVCALLNHQISFALLQMLAWNIRGTCRSVGQGHLSVYLQSQELCEAHAASVTKTLVSNHNNINGNKGNKVSTSRCALYQ